MNASNEGYLLLMMSLIVILEYAPIFQTGAQIREEALKKAEELASARYAELETAQASVSKLRSDLAAASAEISVLERRLKVGSTYSCCPSFLDASTIDRRMKSHQHDCNVGDDRMQRKGNRSCKADWWSNSLRQLVTPPLLVNGRKSEMIYKLRSR